jgi:predicted alpha-1,2-mannosidase
VDVFVGTLGGGNTTPAAALPFGFAQPGPDTASAPSSGYAPGQPLLGFSQTHLSGTGGAGKYGNFRVTPSLGSTPTRLQSEFGLPGSYGAVLDGGQITARLTATRMGAVHRYVFPATRDARVKIDPGSVIDTGRLAQRVVRSSLHVTGPRTLEGGGTFSGGWNPGSYTLWFAARFDRAPHARLARGVTWVFDTRGKRAVEFSIGLSFRSAAAARRNIPRAGFSRTRSAAEAAWRRALGRIAVSGGTPAERDEFATALYHSLLMPHDLSGDNAWWRSSEPHYEDLLALWDTFRTQNPLLGLVYPERETAIVRSLLDTYRHTGWLPDARVAGAPGVTQVGSDADVVVADAIVKGLPGIDRRLAYRALVKDASVQPPHPAIQGRDLRDYRRLGYVSLSEPRSASRTMEYSYDDFAVGEVAERLGHDRDAARWFARSRSWRKLWDQATRSIRPRAADGSFLTPFDPAERLFGFGQPLYEGSALEYSTFVPHDAQGLIDLLGGDAAAVGWLDSLFASGAYDRANEPDLLAPYLYIHAGRPDRTDDVVRGLMASAYSGGRAGLPGNDDSGALSSWYVWSAIGLFPNAGQPYYYIGSPLFTRTRIALPGRRSFTISAPASSAANRYVTGATLNGDPLERAWLTHAEVARGGLLKLEMGAGPNGWGAAQRPFSL